MDEYQRRLADSLADVRRRPEVSTFVATDAFILDEDLERF